MQEVAEVVRICASEGLGIVPQGGNTGLVGGGVPRDGEVVVSLRRLRELDSVDEASCQVTVGAGVTLSELQRHAGARDLMFGVDHAARESATVGGMVATNAGGGQVLRYGMMRAQVTGLEVVLPDGTIVSRLLGLAKDNAGYSWPDLFIGSEGTLGIITRVRLRLRPRPSKRLTALVGMASTREAIALLRKVRAKMPSLDAAEVFWEDGLALVCTHLRRQNPLNRPAHCYMLFDFAGVHDSTEEVWGLIEPAPGVIDTVAVDDVAGRRALWSYREAHNEAIRAVGVPLKMDVSVPLTELVDFETAVRLLFEGKTDGPTAILYGHLGDGNLHINILGAGAPDAALDAVLQLVASHGGSISAEHGVGILKSRWLNYTRSADELELMRSLKRVIDPESIFNPGVIFPRESRSGA